MKKKIKKSTLRKFIKRVITEAMETQNQPDWFVDGGDELVVENFVLSDGREIGFSAYLNGSWDTGEFSHEFGTYKPSGGAQFELEEVRLIKVYDEISKSDIWSNRSGQDMNADLKRKLPDVYAEIMEFVESNWNAIQDKVNENPPEAD